MNCRRIEKLIPLYVESDLEKDEAAQVFAHACACAGCAALIAEYEASQQWLRSHQPPEFDDALFESISRNVVKKITERKPSAFFEFFAFRFAGYRIYAATAAMLIIFAALAFYYYSGNPNAVTNRDEQANADAPPEEDEKQAPAVVPARPLHRDNQRAINAASKNLPGKNRKTESANHLRSEKILAHRATREPSRTTPDAAIKAAEMMRIEFQTSDPNIRIIWLSPEETDSQSFKPMTETD